MPHIFVHDHVTLTWSIGQLDGLLKQLRTTDAHNSLCTPPEHCNRLPTILMEVKQILM